MINLKNIKNQKYSDVKLVEILFCTFPISFIIGNLILSAHLLLFIIVSLILIKKRNLPFRINKMNLIPIFFFLYFFLSTSVQFPNIFDIWVEIKNTDIKYIPLENDPIFKSFLLIRFALLVLVVDILLFNKILNLKKLFFVTLLCTTFVSLDIIFQYLLGFDIFGLKSSTGEVYSGPFGDESIAGTYLQRFSLLSFFFFYFIDFKKNNINKFLLFLIITLHSTSILLSGNRMPLLTFLLGCFFVIILVKNFRFIMSLGMAAFLGIFFIISANDQIIKSRYSTFFEEINLFKHIKVKISKKNIESNMTDEKTKTTNSKSHFLYSGHGSLYKTSIYMWKTQPIFGYGFKGFRFKCWEILVKTNNKKYSCSTHSHNYYFELLSEAGILGLILIVAFFSIILKNSFFYFKKNYKKNDLKFYLFIPILLVFLMEIWPIRSTGSFFTTWNATFTWMIIAILSAVTLEGKKVKKSFKFGYLHFF